METASNNNTRPEVTSLRKLKKKKKREQWKYLFTWVWGYLLALSALYIPMVPSLYSRYWAE